MPPFSFVFASSAFTTEGAIKFARFNEWVHKKCPKAQHIFLLICSDLDILPQVSILCGYFCVNVFTNHRVVGNIYAQVPHYDSFVNGAY